MALAATLTFVSCGKGETAEDEVVAAVEQLHDDMRQGRVRAVCAALASPARHQIGTVGHGRKPTSCEDDLRELVVNSERSLGGGEGLRTMKRPSVESVEIAPDGRRAVAILSLGHGPYRVPLVKQGGEWRLTDFFGAQGPPPKELR